MVTTTFVGGTVIAKEWLNDVDALTYDIFAALSVVPSSGKILRSNGTNIVPLSFC